MTPAQFRNLVWNHYRTHGRHDLPWRATTDPYRILVSEVMLQQTQVERVIPYYRAWLKRFPTTRALAQAPLADVLRAWQGLGYNRRAKALREAAKAVVAEHKGVFPSSVEGLQALPGIGPYTASAVAAFAHNQDAIVVETNIRTAVIHHFFPDAQTVADHEIREVLRKVLPKGRSREWYSALMDYGASLKRSGVRLNSRTKGYTKQSTFKGSDREVRGALLRALSEKPHTRAALFSLFDTARRDQVARQLENLVAEGLIERASGRYCLAD